MDRQIILSQSTYTAYVYGRRLAMTSKLSIPLRGIILEDIAVVDESPLRIIKPTEYFQRNVDFARLGEYRTVVEVGGKLSYFSDQPELDRYVAGLTDWESKIGPVRPDRVFNPDETATSWTLGPKSVLFMRVDFSDRPGEPLDFDGQAITQTRVENLFADQISPFYVNNSYNKTSLQVTAPPVIRLPQPLSFYVENETNSRKLLLDARLAARALGFETNNFDLDMVMIGRTETGLIRFNAFASGFGYKGVTLNGLFDPKVIGHELGHNYGLFHANSWVTTDGTVIGQGNLREYGDYYDLMGPGADIFCHFNAIYKRRLDWLTDSEVKTITSDGEYRIFAHDSVLPGGLRALKIRKDGNRHYWVEFRQLFTRIQNLMDGAMLRWDYPTGAEAGGIRGSLLLDTTPGSTYHEPAIVVGQNFIYNENRIKISVLGKGGTTPESLDVRVEVNIGCTFDVMQASQNFPAAGGEGTIAVTTQPGCGPPVTSNVSWLTPIDDEATTVHFIVAANYGLQQRSGTIIVAGQTVTVLQAPSATSCVPPPSGLVAWWRGEGNGLDQTGVNHGIPYNIYGVPGQNISFGAGKVGGGFLHNSTYNGALLAPDPPTLALTRSLTIEGWLRHDSGYGTVIQRGLTVFPGTQSFDVIAFPSGEIGFRFAEGGAPLLESDPIPLGQFAHFAISLDNATSQAKLYVNGNLVRQNTTALRPNILIGAKITMGNFDGITDELSVYDRALLQSEIQAIYNAGIAVTGATGKCVPVETLVSVSGRVLTPTGLGLRNSVVALTDSQGVKRNSTTSSLGHYLFENIPLASGYTLTVSSKRYRFASRILMVNEILTNVDFMGLE